MTLLLLAACATTAYDPVALQLDVEAPLPDAAETIHVCVTGAGELEQGAGIGRIAFTGLPAGEPAEVRLEVYDVDGALLAAAGPVTVEDYAVTPLTDEGARCEDDGERAPAGSETAVLGLRFSEPEPW